MSKGYTNYTGFITYCYKSHRILLVETSIYVDGRLVLIIPSPPVTDYCLFCYLQ